MVRAAFGRNGYGFSGGRVGNQTQKSHWVWAGVAELMDFVRLDENHVAGGKFVLFVAFKYHAVSFQHENFMFVIVAVPRSVTAGGNFEFSHGESRCAVRLAQQPPNRTAVRAWHFDGLGGNRLMMIDLH